MNGTLTAFLLTAVALVASPPPAPPPGVIPIVWQDPGNVETLDFVGGPGGRAKAPQPPFTFVKENMSGSNPKIQVTDATGRMWNVKWGPEVHGETFATRMAWACGYVVEDMYYVAAGKVLNVGKLTRARKEVDTEGNFKSARFELWDTGYKFLNKPGWTWEDNPFLNSRELNGLKVVLMLVSNWDLKDARNGSQDSNTAILEEKGSVPKKWLYFVSDWGAAMGKWGGRFSRSKWDCQGFSAETPRLIKGVENGYVEWGFQGKHTRDTTENISVADVRWLMQYLGRITNDQLTDGLRVSGAGAQEALCFAEALRARIEKLRTVASATGTDQTEPRLPRPVPIPLPPPGTTSFAR